GMSAGMAAMLVGLAPVLTGILAPRGGGGGGGARDGAGDVVGVAGRRAPGHWVGLALGLAGVWLVVRHKVALTGDGKALVAILLALAGISVGTLYQKRYCSHVDMRCGAVIQFSACALAYAPIVLAFEPEPVRWTPEFMFALGWAVVVLSVGAISLLYWLLRH